MILKRCYLVTQGIILYRIPRKSGRRDIEPGTYVCMLLLKLLIDQHTATNHNYLRNQTVEDELIFEK
jgi:hypothetical protein